MTEWIEANLEAAEGQTLDLPSVADRFLRRSTRAERRKVPDPEAEIRKLLPVKAGKIIGFRLRPDMVMTSSGRESEGPVWRRPRHTSEWNME